MRVLTSILALFGKVSSDEQLVQGVRLDAGLKLLMKPIEDLSTMTTLDFTACLPNGDMALPPQERVARASFS